MEGCSDIRHLTAFNSKYEAWLWSKLDFTRKYGELFRLLYDTEFTWTIPMDENRATDGIYLRDRFSYESGEYLPDGWRDWPCSVLEMLASLALTIEESFLYDPESGTDAGTWFWEMARNCGLTDFDDEMLSTEAGRAAAEHILRRIMDRRYGPSGEGGIFPLKDVPEDLREMEIWDQMNLYLIEKMPF